MLKFSFVYPDSIKILVSVIFRSKRTYSYSGIRSIECTLKQRKQSSQETIDQTIANPNKMKTKYFNLMIYTTTMLSYYTPSIILCIIDLIMISAEAPIYIQEVQWR